MRCFVAVDLSAPVRAAAARLQEGMRAAAGRADVRWTEPAGFHLTLKFLGEVPEVQVPAVVAALDTVAAASAPLALAAGGAGAFPSVRRPRVVWVGVTTGAAELARLARAVEEALAPLGFPPEGRGFHGHLTLGRVRAPRALAGLARAIEDAPALEASGWTAVDIVLYRSHLRRTGAVYEPVARVPLGRRHT